MNITMTYGSIMVGVLTLNRHIAVIHPADVNTYTIIITQHEPIEAFRLRY